MILRAARWGGLVFLAFLFCWSLSAAIVANSSRAFSVTQRLTLGSLVMSSVPVLATAAVALLLYVWKPEELTTGRLQLEGISPRLLPVVAGLSLIVVAVVQMLFNTKFFSSVDFVVVVVIAAGLCLSLFLALTRRVVDGICVYILTWPFISFAEAQIWLFSQTVHPEWRGPIPLTTMTAWLLLLFLIWLARGAMERRKWVRSSFEPGLLLFLVAGLVASLGSMDVGKSLWFCFPQCVILPIMAFILFLNTVRSWNDVKRIFQSVAVSGAIIMILGLYYASYRSPDVAETIVPGVLSLYGPIVRLLGPIGTYPYALAILLLPLIMALIATSKRRVARALWIGTSLLFVFVVIISFSRSGWVMLVIGMLPWSLGTAWGRRLSAVAIPILIGVVLLFPTEIDPFFVRFRSFQSLDTFLSEDRMGIWEGSIQMFLDHPWTGIGIGMWEKAAPGYDAIAAIAPRDPVTGYILYYQGSAHSGLLDVAAQAGVMGILAWIAMLSALGLETLRMVRTGLAGANPYAMALLGASLILIVGFFIGAGPLTNVGVELPGSNLWWLTMAMVAVASRFPLSSGQQAAVAVSSGKVARP